jgi:hypothetical protein
MTFQFIKAFPRAVKSKGAVSPAILATLMSTPVMIPLSPAGKMTLRIVL